MCCCCAGLHDLGVAVATGLQHIMCWATTSCSCLVTGPFATGPSFQLLHFDGGSAAHCIETRTRGYASGSSYKLPGPLPIHRDHQSPLRINYTSTHLLQVLVIALCLQSSRVEATGLLQVCACTVLVAWIKIVSGYLRLHVPVCMYYDSVYACTMLVCTHVL